MLTYRRFDPFAGLDHAFSPSRTRPSSVPMDAVRREDEVVAYFDLPGADAATLDLTVDGNQLTLKADRRFEPDEGDRLIASERPRGSFSRTLQLGENLDAENVHADYHDGVLVVTIPFAETAKPRKVAIGATAGPIDVASDEA